MRKLVLFIIVLSLFTFQSYAWEEGGYIGNDPTSKNVVYNFIKHFSYEQYFWGKDYMFTYRNNKYVDSVDFAYYCGHGNKFLICVYKSGSSGPYKVINLGSAGGSSHAGYGYDLEFIVFHSCSTIPSPRDTVNWWQPWVTESDDIFDGLHLAMGFRTSALKATAPYIANYYGRKVKAGGKVAASWLDAINACGNHSKKTDYGSILFQDLAAKNDIYMKSHSADPSATSRRLYVWYQY